MKEPTYCYKLELLPLLCSKENKFLEIKANELCTARSESQKTEVIVKYLHSTSSCEPSPHLL